MTLYLDATSVLVRMYFYVFSLKKIKSKLKEACKANQTDDIYWVLSHHTEDEVFILEVVYELAEGLILLTMI